MKKRIQLFVLSALCTVFAFAQYAAPSEGVFRIVNVAYNAALMEDFVNSTLHCTAKIGDNDDYEQLWILKVHGTGYSLQNVFTGAYVQTGNSGTEVNYWTDATPKTFKIEAAEKENAYSIWDSGLSAGQGLHSKGANGNVVRWVACDASSWRFIKVDLSDEEIAAARAEFERLTGGDKLDDYQAVLDEVFADKACTVLSEAYAAKSAEEIEAALADKLPAALVAMAVKVKNDTWSEANEKANKPGWNDAYAKKFRVQMIEPYSIAGEITEWIGHQGHTNMDNPTGLYANKREVLYVMVEGEIKEGAELWGTWIVGHSKMPNYNNGYSNGIRLHEGLNLIPIGGDGSALYINYLVHTYDKNKKKFTNKLSNYDDLKVHVEGGYINGYYNAVGDALYEADNDDDWVYYEERANLENITILGRYEVLQFELNDVIGATNDKGEVINEKGLAYYFPEQLPTSMPNSPAFTAPNQRINAIVEAWDRIFLSEKMTLGVASKAEVDSMNKLFPRYDATWKEKAEIYNYDDALFAFCDSIKDRDGDYGEYYNHHGLAYGTRSGYMYGSWDHCGYHINTTHSILTCIATEAGPTWGPAHEIGHQHQALYTLNGEMEVTNNTFANIAVWYMGMGTSRVNGTEGNLAHVYDNFKAGNYIFGNNIWALTQRYYRLWLYYHRAGNNTQFYPRLFELIRQKPMERSYGSGSEMRPNDKGVMEETGFQLTNGYRSYLHFYKLCCEAAQEDLTEFFRAYGCFVPVDGAFQGDYTNSKYYTTQKEIDKAIAEVKAKGYPVNNKVLFINDCTDRVTYGHDGKTRRTYWDGESGGGKNAETGLFVDYLRGEPITGEYLYSLIDLKLSISGGQGALGFAVYNKQGEIQAFSNNHTFYLNKDVANMLRSGEATLYAVGADNNDVAVKNKALGGTEEEQLANLKKALEVAKGYLEKVDETASKVGYLLADSVANYAALVATIENVIKNADTSEYTYGEWYVALDAANVEILTKQEYRVPFKPDCFYSLSTSNSTDARYLAPASATSASLSAVKQDVADNVQWRIIPAEAEDTYYFLNRASGNYISTVNSGARVKAESADIANAVALKVVPDAPGEFYIQRANNADIALYNDPNLNYQVYSAKQTGAKAKWYLNIEDDMLSQPIAKTDEQITIYYIQRNDNKEYAAHKDYGRTGKGQVTSGKLDGTENLNYWFYFVKGSQEGKYAIYNFATGMPITVQSGSLYANKAADPAPEYTIALNEEGNGLEILAEEGAWYIELSQGMAELSNSDTTSWKLQRVRTISLTNEPLTSLTINETAVTLTEGQEVQLAVTTGPQYATDHTVTWTSNKTDIATVDATGLVKAIAAGNATITATANDASGLKGTCTVTVTGNSEQGITEVATSSAVQYEGGVITINGLAAGTAVSVYDAAGSLIAKATAKGNTTVVATSLKKGSTAIVKVGNNTMKVSVR